MPRLRNHIAERVGMIRYAESRSRGGDIGRRPTEGLCQAMGARLKGSGMRWDPAAAPAMRPLTVLEDSNECKRHWKRQPCHQNQSHLACLQRADPVRYKDGVENRVIAILGCTASGKATLARALAAGIDAEIISVDSMKVYRGMDIGTAKPTPEQRAAVPHHLIDVADPWEPFSAARFVDLADQAVAGIHGRDRPAIAVGGTMLYFKCFYEGMFAGPSADPAIRAEIRARVEREGLGALHAELARIDPEAAARIHRNDLRRIERALEVYRLTGKPISTLQKQWDRDSIRRPDWRWTLIGVRREREATNRRINERVRRMFAAGLVEEAQRIWRDPRGVSDQARRAVGYAELFDHFEGRLSLEDAVEQIKINSRRLAKQQRTWLKRLADVRWIDVDDSDRVGSLVRRVRESLD